MPTYPYKSQGKVFSLVWRSQRPERQTLPPNGAAHLSPRLRTQMPAWEPLEESTLEPQHIPLLQVVSPSCSFGMGNGAGGEGGRELFWGSLSGSMAGAAGFQMENTNTDHSFLG